MKRKHNPVEREKQKIAIAKFFLMGFPITRISEQTGVPRPTVYRYLEEMDAEWEKTWLPAYETVRTRKVAELANLKSEVYTGLMVAQKEGDLYAISKLGGLVARIIEIECRIFNLYEKSYNTQLNVEELIRDYEKEKLDIAENNGRPPKRITQVEY